MGIQIKIGKKTKKHKERERETEGEMGGGWLGERERDLSAHGSYMRWVSHFDGKAVR